jgi:hypothetical protein
MIRGNAAMSRQRSISCALKVTASVVLVFCAVVSCILSIAGFADEWEEVEYPQIIVEKEVAIDTQALPEQPRMTDWYPLAVQILKDDGWDLAPNLTKIRALCTCEPGTGLIGVEMSFADAYLSGLIPSLRLASISFDPGSDRASVLIAYQALRWRHKTLDLDELGIGLHEAIEIADRHGGQEYRETMKDACEVTASITGDHWIVRFRGSRQSSPTDIEIRVDAQSGKAKRLTP